VVSMASFFKRSGFGHVYVTLIISPPACFTENAPEPLDNRDLQYLC
jgi:hypothetical protein